MGGIHPRTVPNHADGTLSLDDIEAAVRPATVHFPRTRLILLENTHNRCNGNPLDTGYMGDVRKLGRPGGFAVGYYLMTTVLAVGTGLVVVNIINPGVNIEKKLVEDARREGAEAVQEANEALSTSKPVTWTRHFDDDELILESKTSELFFGCF